jgi:hypothetical protein
VRLSWTKLSKLSFKETYWTHHCSICRPTTKYINWSFWSKIYSALNYYSILVIQDKLLSGFALTNDDLSEPKKKLLVEKINKD